MRHSREYIDTARLHTKEPLSPWYGLPLETVVRAWDEQLSVEDLHTERREWEWDMEDSYLRPVGDWAYSNRVNFALWYWLMGLEDLVGLLGTIDYRPERWLHI